MLDHNWSIWPLPVVWGHQQPEILSKGAWPRIALVSSGTWLWNIPHLRIMFLKTSCAGLGTGRCGQSWIAWLISAVGYKAGESSRAGAMSSSFWRYQLSWNEAPSSLLGSQLLLPSWSILIPINVNGDSLWSIFLHFPNLQIFLDQNMFGSYIVHERTPPGRMIEWFPPAACGPMTTSQRPQPPLNNGWV